MSDYCDTEGSEAAPEAPVSTEAGAPVRTEAPVETEGPPFAQCVLCLKLTEYPESYKGITLCPVCEWQEAQRTACSG